MLHDSRFMIHDFKKMITRAQKEKIIEDLKKIIGGASVLVFVNFHGLSVAKTRNVRSELRKVGIAYKVAKKTLLRRAADAAGLGDMPEWEGEIGVAAGYGDATEAPRILAKFAKGNGELKIAGGFYEHAFVDAGVMNSLASVPSREALLTQLAFMLTQPVAGLARAINEVSKKQN